METLLIPSQTAQLKIRIDFHKKNNRKNSAGLPTKSTFVYAVKMQKQIKYHSKYCLTSHFMPYISVSDLRSRKIFPQMIPLVHVLFLNHLSVLTLTCSFGNSALFLT